MAVLSRRLGGWLALSVLAAGGCSASPPVVTATPRVALLDAPLTLTVDHLAAGERVTVSAITRDAEGNTWSATRAVVARPDGEVVLAAAGLLEDLAPGDGYQGGFAVPSAGETVRFSVRGAGRALGSVSVRRELSAPGTVRSFAERPATSGFFGQLYQPATDSTQRPAVLLFGGSEGGLPSPVLATLLAAHGYPTLALAYFGEPGLPATLTGIRLEYFARALRSSPDARTWTRAASSSGERHAAAKPPSCWECTTRGWCTASSPPPPARW